MVIFVPSHAGLALLLMVTLYPILIRSGVSPMSALGVIGCAQFVDVGPGSGNAILAAQTAGVDVSEYFVYYQLPLFVGVVIILTFVHMFVQRWWDKREGWVLIPTIFRRWRVRTCKSSKDHSKPRNEVDTSLKSPV